MLRFQAVSMSVDDVSLKCPYSRADGLSRALGADGLSRSLGADGLSRSLGADGLSRALGCIVTEPAQKEAVGQPTVYKERFLLQMAKRAQHGNI